MDNKNAMFFIDMLSSFVNNSNQVSNSNIDSNTDWNEIIKLANIHNVTGIVYLAAKKLQDEYKPDIDVIRRLEKDFFITALRSEYRNNAMESLINAFNEAEIPHILFKGYVIKNYYPVNEMRTMGDIDILIKPKDREKSHKLLLSLGYKTGELEEEVWHYSNNVVSLEIHTKIMYHNIHNGIDYVQYFSEVWDHTIKTSRKYTFELSIEYHFIYIIVHLAKHFDGKGCGIRMIMDIAVFLNYFRDQLNWAYVNEEFEKLNLSLFSLNIFILCKRWFGTSFNFMLPDMDETYYKDLSNYIISAGTFGFYERDSAARVIRMELHQGDVGNIKKVKIAAMIKIYFMKLFPSYKEMCKSNHYWFVVGKPLLLPIAWIYRIFRLAKDICKSSKEAEKQYEIITKIGL